MSKKLILNQFFKIRSEDILKGVDAIHDSKVFDELLNSGSDGLIIALDSKLQEIAFLWIECDQDECLTRLNY